MSDLAGAGGELRFTMTIVRKATGATEHFDMVAAATEEQARALGATVIDADTAKDKEQ
jgi:hypothetical protein